VQGLARPGDDPALEQRVSVRSRCGISEKWFGTSSQPPFQYASRVAGERK
jgi:hypothetical protein